MSWRRIRVLVDGVNEQLVVRNGGKPMSIPFSEIANVLHSRDSRGHEAMIVRRLDQSQVVIGTSNEQVRSLLGELSYHGFVIEESTELTGDAPNTFKNGAIIFAAIHVGLVAYLVWLVP